MNTWFAILATVTLAGACAAMMLRGMVHCALSLAVAFAGFGAMYVNLGAQFLGLAQLLVYVGAVAVLIVFVVLLTLGETDLPRFTSASLSTAGVLVAVAVFAATAWACLHSRAIRLPAPQVPQGNTRQLGTALMSGFTLPLEMVGLVLTVALIGAVIVAMKERQSTQ